MQRFVFPSRSRAFFTAGMCLLLMLCAMAAHADEFFLRNGDRPVCFLGDSITDRSPYGAYIETYVLTRFPTWTINFRNIGWSGDTSWLSQRGGFDNGMKRDILSLKPMVITIDFGMNDARGGDGAYPRYIEYSTKLVQQLKAAGARVALLTPSPEEKYIADQPAGSAYNNMLWKYSQALKEIANKEGVLFIDQYTPFVKVIEDGRKAGVLGTTGDPRLIPDSVHPNASGHLVMAANILKGMHAPALVSRVALDAGAKKVTEAQACKVEILDGADLSFRRTDEALPWFIPPDAQLAMKIPGFTPLDDLNRYELQVTNLPAAKYDLFIDDAKVGTYTKEALAAGVNLALQAGPITAQAAKVYSTVTEKNNLFWNRWRTVQVYTLPAWLTGLDIEPQRQTELARIDAQIAEKEQQLTTLRQLVPHVWKLTAAP